MADALTLDQIPDELVDDAVDAWHDVQADGPLLLDDLMRCILAQLLPGIRRDVAGDIAKRIEQSVCAPGGRCTDRFCTDCTKYRQAMADAALAREIGGDRG